MVFPTKFPKGNADQLQPRISHVPLHEYALHLLRYSDQCFGKHPRFRYFLLNIIMLHRSQDSTVVFVQKSMHKKAPTTIEDLRSLVCNLPEQKLAESLMRFGSSIRGTRAYWNKCRSELTYIITQLRCQIVFFTLSAADTKWPDLYSIMLHRPQQRSRNEHSMKIENVIQYPHIFAMYMHQRFTIFCEEILEKYFRAKDLWYRFVFIHVYLL